MSGSSKKTPKSPAVVKIISEAIDILTALGILIDNQTERQQERIAMAFLAVAGVTEHWTQATDKRLLKTRDIIEFYNQHFEENISSGSYDDIRRKDLADMVIDEVILNRSPTNPDAATNDSTRGYCLASDISQLIHHYGTEKWDIVLNDYLVNKKITLKEKLERKRPIEKISVRFSNGKEVTLSSGQHNLLQKQIVEEFLPRYGKNSQILYLGDTAQKQLYCDDFRLKQLQFFELSHGTLPDIIAYDSKSNWLYVIEAVHSSGVIDELRLLKLQELTKNCTAEIIYITAFLNRSEFKKWAGQIAWETEVWIADNPDHLIHFNGHKFLGPYSKV